MRRKESHPSIARSIRELLISRSERSELDRMVHTHKGNELSRTSRVIDFLSPFSLLHVGNMRLD